MGATKEETIWIWQTRDEVDWVRENINFSITNTYKHINYTTHTCCSSPLSGNWMLTSWSFLIWEMTAPLRPMILGWNLGSTDIVTLKLRRAWEDTKQRGVVRSQILCKRLADSWNVSWAWVYPVLLLGLQLFDPLQKTPFGSLHIGGQARYLDYIELLLRLRHPDVHLRMQIIADTFNFVPFLGETLTDTPTSKSIFPI